MSLPKNKGVGLDDLPAADRACAETHLLLTELALPLDKNTGGKPLSERLYAKEVGGGQEVRGH
jgi:hypothetical protein